jgi:hypothetical protein
LFLVRAKPVFIARAIGIAVVVAAPWYLYVAYRHAPDRDFYPVTMSNVTHYTGRVPAIARLFLLNLLATSEWSILWLATLALVLRALLRGTWRGLVLLVPVVLPLAFFVMSLSLSAWPDYMLHVRTSLDRLILVTVPFALWFVVDQTVDIARGRGKPRVTALPADGD